jgi:hypothetical protein
MSKRGLSVFAGLCALLMVALCAVPSSAQMAEVKQKPAMYSYVANWEIPRAHWAEMAAANSADKAILDKALADGTIVGYGDDINLVHSNDGWTHDDWWSSMSMAGLVKVLDQLTSGGSTSSSVLSTATKHYDLIFVSHYYNWKPGAYKGGYVMCRNTS